jgi:hypothetical protein
MKKEMKNSFPARSEGNRLKNKTSKLFFQSKSISNSTLKKFFFLFSPYHEYLSASNLTIMPNGDKT